MTANNIGKALVLFNLVLSVLFMTFALAIYTQQIDWGWKEPREELGERVPSEIDKRSAAIGQALSTEARVEAELKVAQDALGRIDQVWPTNHLAYVAELNRLESDPGKIDIKMARLQGGVPVLDPAKPQQPLLDQAVGADKSYASYNEDYRKVLEEMETVHKTLLKLVAQQADLSLKLNGVFDKDAKKLIKPGLYQLLEVETQALKRVKEEVEYIRPLWVRELVDAQLLLERRLRLETRLEELKKRPKDGKVAAR